MKRHVILFTVLLASLAGAGQLGAQGFSSVPSLSFVKPYSGANPLSQVFTVTSTGANFTFYTSSSTTTGGNWLKVSGYSVYGSTTPTVLVATITASPDLAAGTYNGSIVVEKSSGSISMTIPVSLTVAAPGSPYLDNIPGQVSFSLETGGVPVPQPLQVRNGGGSALSWTAAVSTSSGGSWLQMNATSGTTPSTPTVSVIKQNLPGGGLVDGSFTGLIVIQSSSGNVTVPVTVTVRANAFRQLNALSFVKAYGSPDPLSQLVTVASTGSSFEFYTSWEVVSGGNWLSVSGYSVYGSPTPTVLQVAVNAAADLASGTYTAQVRIRAASGSMEMTIPVSLTVTAPGETALFDDVPGQVGFSFQTNSGVPIPQNVPIRNGGSGTLNWTASVSTSDAGNWLQVSPTNGTAPSNLNVSVVRANLPGAGLIDGRFIGLIVLQSDSGPVTIPVNVTVGANVFRQVNPLNFTKAYGTPDPLSQLVTIASTGSNFEFSTAWEVVSGGDWFSVSGYSVYGSPTPTVLKIAVNAAADLAPGIYTGQILVRAASGSTEMTIPVSLRVAAPGTAFFDSLPGQVSFSFKTNGSPVSQSVQLRNGGSGTLNWTAAVSTSDGGSWLQVSATSGTAPSNLTVSVNKANLPSNGLLAGRFTGQIVLQTSSGPATIPVNVAIGDNVFKQVNALSFIKGYGLPDPLSQLITIASTGSSFEFYTGWEVASGGDWLSVDGYSVYGSSTPTVLRVTINASANLAPGIYTAQILLRSNPGTTEMTVPVTLTVPESGTAFLADVPGQVSVSFKTGAGLPAPHQIRIGKAGTGALRWTATVSTSDGGDWLRLNALSGPAPATLTASVVKANLPGDGLISGSFTGAIVLQSSAGAVTIPVTVTVGDNVFSQLNALVLKKPTGGSGPFSQTITISSTGANFNFYIGWEIASGGSWLSVTGYSVYGSSTPQVLTITANPAANLASGIYTGQILIRAASGSMEMTIPVILKVGGVEDDPFPPPMQFVPVTPCRIADTRNANGSLGGPAISGGTARSFPVPSSNCGIPGSAAAYSLNVTVVPHGLLGYVTAYPSGQTPPLASTLNSLDGRVKANAAIVPAGTGGAVSIFASHNTDLILDINGYFVDPTSSTLAFYKLAPCRIADTRSTTGSQGGPSLAGGGERTFPVRNICGVPATAQAYSLNYTAVPKGTLGYITTWPAGGSRPLVSTLNAPTGIVTANAAIVPAGVSGSVSVFATNNTDLVIDINGYFAPSGAGGLSLFNLNPCRVIDTRETAESPATLGIRSVNVLGSACGVPATAQGYVLGATVVPPGLLGYLTLWPEGQTQPLASTLNALDGAITSNMAIVPTSNGSIHTFELNPTHVILDIFGYFAPIL